MSDLEQLEQQALILDQEVAQDNSIPDQQAAQAQILSLGNSQYQQLLKQCLGIIVVGASVPYPIVRDHYTPEVVNEIAAAIIAICDEYGISLQQWLGVGGGKMQAWLRLIMAAGLPAVGLLAAIKQQSEAQGSNNPTNDLGENPRTDAPIMSGV